MKNGIASLMIAMLLVTGCASAPAGTTQKPSNVKEWLAKQSRSKRKAILFGVAGALIGGAHAYLTGGSPEQIVERALAGGIAGALAGLAIGKHEDRIYAHRDLAIREASYDRSQGYIARIEEVSFRPAEPKPGESATLYVRYLVLGPNPNEPIKVKMFRGLKYGDEYVFGAGPNEFVVPKGGGVVESEVQLTLPKKAPHGTYAVEALLEDVDGRFPQAMGTGALYIVAPAEHGGGARTAAR